MSLTISTKKKIVKWLWITFFAGILSIVLLFGSLLLTNLPGFEELENPQQFVASEVYYDDLTLMSRYYVENRVIVPYKDLNPYLVQALLATEDKRFYRHSGIDFASLPRVVVKSLILQQSESGGASTITQQLAKLLYDRPDTENMGKLGRIFSLVVTKFKEWIIAVRLERAYTKDEIITMYLNHFDFLYDSHGIQAASETYFGKNQEDLTIEEAAMLIGMLKNPWYYNPIRRTDQVKGRRMVVLKQMEKQDFLTSEVYDSLKVLPMDMNAFQRSSHAIGLATYFRMEMRKACKHILSQPECKKPDGSVYDIDRDGLKIYTTIDKRIQQHAEKAMLKNMAKLQEVFFRHWNSIKEDPWEYAEDESNVELKQANLRAQMRLSGRYQKLRVEILEPKLKEVEEKFDIVLNDPDILRMLEVAQDKSEINKYIATKTISRDKSQTYFKIIHSDFWPGLKEDWRNFEKKVDDHFNTKVEMKVFTYENSSFEKDTVMSPLDSIKYHRKHLQVGILAMEPGNGHIKAWVGGINMKYFQQDHIFTNRQVGSTFKPFVYATAIAHQGISPCFRVDDVQYTINKGEGNFNIQENWSPKNSNGEYEETPITLYEALRKSKNSVSVYLVKQINSVQPIINIAANLGIDENKLPPVPSICLGTPDLTLFEMTGAYGAFANNGIYHKPIFINRIEDKNGRLIYKSIAEERRSLPEEANYVLVDMLKYAGLSAKNSLQIKSEFGGKTGTTQNHSDGWFMGITPSLVVGTWVGGEDRWIRFRDLNFGQGGYMARPIVLDLIKSLEDDPDADYDKNAKFYKPELQNITIDCTIYDRLNPQIQADDFNESDSEEFF